MTKSGGGGQFVLASPAPNSGGRGLVPSCSPPVIYAHARTFPWTFPNTVNFHNISSTPLDNSLRGQFFPYISPLPICSRPTELHIMDCLFSFCVDFTVRSVVTHTRTDRQKDIYQSVMVMVNLNLYTCSAIVTTHEVSN